MAEAEEKTSVAWMKNRWVWRLRRRVINCGCPTKKGGGNNIEGSKATFTDSRYKILADLSYQILATSFWLPDPCYPIPATRGRLSDPGFQIKGYQILAT